ncbi:MAG TPA: response regulator [Humisphaera sp.]
MANVLVVDDQPDLCTILVRLLGLMGHRAEGVLDGAAALAAVRTAPPDLVVLDVMMPGLSGIDVLRTMRNDDRTRRVPVLMYTALADPDTEHEARSLGVRGYLVKSRSTFEELEAVVAQTEASDAQCDA